ncbi:MAG: DUF3857 domain-containing transglutaminase family protein [Colwellia sp.]|nr:DUF3857 domain-containing transglutaminase family protein [Colwellia sp.]
MKRTFLYPIYWLLTCVLFLCNAPAYATQYKIDAPGNWVTLHDVKQPQKSDMAKVRDGTLYLLLDNQTYVPERQKQQRYTRLVMQALNQSGVDYISQLSLDFDPSYQTLTLHTLSIIRDGKHIDKLSTARLSVIQSEPELADKIYNGRLSLNIIVDDMRSGDMLDYSYSVTGSNPIYANKFSTRRTLRWSVPVVQQYMRVLWGKKTPLNIKTINGTAETKQTENQYGTDYSISEFEAPLLTQDSETPTWYNPYMQVYLSEYNSWDEVVNWALPLYESAIETPSSINAIAQSIQAQHTNTADRIAAALRFSQDEIRYLGLEMGTNSHQPTPASETLSLRYGDCKDKTTLLISLLEAMKIKAYPALVDTEETKRLIELPATASVFNHVIVTLEHKGKRYWLDPTISYQRGTLPYLAQPDYGYALIIKNGENTLTPMAQTPVHKKVTVNDQFYIPKTVKEPVLFTTEYSYAEFQAINRRSNLARNGLDSVAKSYLEYYQGFFDELKIDKPMAVSEDQQTGQFITSESYLISQFWGKTSDGYEADFYASEIQNSVYEPKQTNRTDPLYFEYPNIIDTSIKLHFTEKNWAFDNSQDEIDNDYFYLKTSVSFNDNVLTLSYHFYAKKDYIPADKISDYLAQRNKLISATHYSILKYANTTEAPQTTADILDNLGGNWLKYALAGYLLLFIFFIADWRLESAKRPTFENNPFYAVSVSKFIIYSILSLGIYINYWCYRNFKAIKQHSNANIMPIARGIFAILWYYPLYQALKQHSELQSSKSKIIPSWGAAVLFLLVLATTLVYRMEEYATIALLVMPFLWLPLVSYIEHANTNQKALHYNSYWRVRQCFMSLALSPILLFGVLQEANILPGSAIIKGEKLWAYQTHFLKRNRLTPENEDVLYFYSDAMFDYRDDGNGITDNYIFSYYKNDAGKLESDLSHFNDIDKIETSYGKTELDNTTIKVIKTDGSDFLLIVSRFNKLDEVLVDKINLRLSENKKE